MPLSIVAQGADDAAQLLQALPRPLEVALAGRELDLGDEHGFEEVLLGPRDRLRLGEPPPRLFHVLDCSEDVTRRDAHAYALRPHPRLVDPLDDAVAEVRRVGRGAHDAHRGREALEPPGELRRRPDRRIREGDRVRVVARRRLELARREAALAAPREVRGGALAIARLVEMPRRRARRAPSLAPRPSSRAPAPPRRASRARPRA